MTPKHFERAQELIRQFVGIQRELFDMGLPVSATHLSKAVDKMGWEMAEKCEAEGRVTKNEARRRAARFKDHGFQPGAFGVCKRCGNEKIDHAPR